LSLALGTVGMMLFFLPILGGPISAFGLLFGLLGIAFAPHGVHLRWSLLGCAASATGLAISLAVTYPPAS
jgi:hypothetical protein